MYTTCSNQNVIIERLRVDQCEYKNFKNYCDGVFVLQCGISNFRCNSMFFMINRNKKKKQIERFRGFQTGTVLVTNNVSDTQKNIADLKSSNPNKG